MSDKIEIEVPDCNSYECTSELILENDVIKVEVDMNDEYEECVDSPGIKSELKNVFDMPSKNAENCRNYRIRKKLASQKIKKPPKTSAERSRMYRLRKKQLAEGSKLSANTSFIYLYTPSTSNSQMTLESSPQPVTTEIILKNEIIKSETHMNNEGEEYRDQTDIKLELTNDEESPASSKEGSDEQTNKIAWSKRGPLRHVCKFCNKAFNRPGLLRKHELVHTKLPVKKTLNDTKNCICQFCNKAFKYNSALLLHISSHLGEKPFRCDVCGEAFAHTFYLKRHKNIHTDIRPFVCDICNKSFKQRAHLNLHHLSHTGAKKFFCDVCGRGFNHKSHLKTHKNVHSDVKPHVCDVCNKGFKRADALRLHKCANTKTIIS